MQHNSQQCSFQGWYCSNLTIPCELYCATIDTVNNFLKQYLFLERVTVIAEVQ